MARCTHFKKRLVSERRRDADEGAVGCWVRRRVVKRDARAAGDRIDVELVAKYGKGRLGGGEAAVAGAQSP